MVMSIHMTITGTDLAKFTRGLPVAEAKGGERGTKVSVNNIVELARLNAPKSGRPDGISNHITSKKIDRQTYQIYVSPIQPWPAYSPNAPNVSRKAAKVYPLAQERGYRGHWIHTQMIDPELRGKYEQGKGPRRIFVKRFTPYMLPAYLNTIIKNQKELQKELRRELNKLKKRSRLKGGLVGNAFTT